MLATVLVLGFALRVSWWLYAQPVPVSDFHEYEVLGRAVADHGQLGYPGLSASRLPGFPVFLAAMMFFGRGLLWLSFTNVVLSVGVIAVTRQLAYRLSSGNAVLANLAGLLCALNPAFVFFSPVLASEALFTLLLMSALGLAIVNGGRGTMRLMAAGLALGAATLTRGEGLFYLPAVLAASYVGPKLGMPLWRRTSLVTLALLLVIGPWYLRNVYYFGPGVGLSATAGVNLYFAHNPDQYGWWPDEPGISRGSMLQAGREGTAYALRYVREAPSHLLENAVKGSRELTRAANYGVHWSTIRDMGSEESGAPPVTADLAGRTAFMSLERKGWRFLAVLSIVALFFRKLISRAAWTVIGFVLAGNWICFALVFWAKPRFRYAPEAVLCIAGGVALLGLVGLFRRISLRMQSG